MKKIGVIGAPGTGKSKFAQDLENSLDREVIVIDDYIGPLTDQADLALGFHATYVGNLWVALGRMARERQAEARDPEVMITCGTLIETMMYAAADGVNNEEYADDLAVHRARAVLTMQTLGSLMDDIFVYDVLFYLPYDGTREGHLKAFDEHLPEAMEVWDLNPIVLRGTPEEKLAYALTALPEVSGRDPVSGGPQQ